MSSDKVSLDVISGIRCLLCLWVFVFHVYYFIAPSAPISHEFNAYFRNIPILGFFLNSNLGVDAFWILSGFLCEYQLQTKIDPSNTFNYIIFLINRFLRIVPLHYVNIVLGMQFPGSICTEMPKKIAAFLLVEIYYLDPSFAAPKCSGVGWTINPDWHAYVVMVILFVVFRNNVSRKNILYGLFVVSCVVSVYYAYAFNIEWPVMGIGMETTDPEQSKEFKKSMLESNPDMDINSIPDALPYYPDYDPYSDAAVRWRKIGQLYGGKLYFTGIERHGAAMFLGGILAIDFIDYLKTPRNAFTISNIIKLVSCVVLFYIIDDLRSDLEHRSPIWTVLYTKLFDILAYLVIQLCLYIANSPTNIGKIIGILLGNRIFKFLGKFTYAFYLIHLTVLIIMVFTDYPIKKDTNGEWINKLNKSYVWNMCIKCFGITLVLSMITYYMIEYPMQKCRKKYIQNKYKTKQKQL